MKQTCTNPVIPGTHPDPSVCRVGDDYYLATSSFVYYPGAPIFHSKDLVHWRQIGNALTRPEQMPLDGIPTQQGMWAPSLRHINGRFYMVTTRVDWHGKGSRHFYVHTDDPAGEWSDPIHVDVPGIDPDLFQDNDGKVYFLCNNACCPKPRGLLAAEIDLETGKLKEELQFLWTGTGGFEPEAPHLYHIGDYYYLLVAEDGTFYEHMATIARSRDLYGPYESCPQNPILSHRDLNPSPVKCTGHADLVQDHLGNWWMVFLAVRPQSAWADKQHLGRETFLAPVTWEDDWPIVNGGEPIRLETEGPLLPQHPWPATPERQTFDIDRLPLGWSTLRQPKPGTWSLTARPGWLRLTGNEAAISEEGTAPAFVGRWQEEMTCRISTLLDFDPQEDGEEAGLTTFMREGYHYAIGITRKSGKRTIFLRRQVGDLVAQDAETPLPGGPVTLICEAKPDTFIFSFVASDGIERLLGAASSHLICVETAGVFTGMILALYATGNGKPSTSPADFAWFEVRKSCRTPRTANVRTRGVQLRPQ